MKHSLNYKLEILAKLADTIDVRSNTSGEESYTAKLLAKGSAKCAEKFGEEAIEAIIAGVSQGDEALIGETADVIFHMLVLLKSRKIPLSKIMIELEKRMQQSGLQEKASRPKS